MKDLLLWLGLMFLVPFFAIVAGAHYQRWLSRKGRMPRVFDRRDT